MKNYRLKSLRSLYEITQSEMACAIGSTTSNYCSKENGKRQFKQQEMNKIYMFFKKIDEKITLDDIFLPIEVTERKQK